MTIWKNFVEMRAARENPDIESLFAEQEREALRVKPCDPLIGLAGHVDFDAPTGRIDDAPKYQVPDSTHFHNAALRFDELLSA